MTSKKDVPGSKSARKVVVPSLLQELVERGDALGLDDAKSAFARLKRESEVLTTGLVTAVDKIRIFNRELERLAKRIAKLETDPEASAEWQERQTRLRRVNDDKHRRTINMLIEMLSKTLVIGRIHPDMQRVAELLEEQVLTIQWLEACAYIRQLFMAEQNRREAAKRDPQRPEHEVRPIRTSVSPRDLLVAVDKNAVKLTDDDVFEALRDQRIKAPNGKPVELAKFAARLAARCGALGNKPEDKLHDRFKKHRK